MLPYLKNLLKSRSGEEEAYREDTGREFDFGLVREGAGVDAVFSFVDTKLV